MELTRYKAEKDGHRYTLLDWEGYEVRVYDSALTALLLIELFKDDTLDTLTKAETATELLFVDAARVAATIRDLGGLMVKSAWEVAGLDIDGSHGDSDGRKVIDWDADADYIRASLWQTYGRSFDEIAASVSFAELGSMIGLCPHETPMGQALYYRTADPPSPNQYNQEEIRVFNRRRSFWALDNDGADAMAVMNGNANDAAESIRRMIERSRTDG